MWDAVRIDLSQLPECRGWLKDRWVRLNSGLSVVGVNECGIWHNDSIGSTGVVSWGEIVVAVL